MNARHLFLVYVALGVMFAAKPVAVAQTDGTPEDNGGNNYPTGVTGSFNGNVTTGCSYDAFTGNARRVVEDIVVPGTVSVYGLKWIRTYNSRQDDATDRLGSFGISWLHSYRWTRTANSGNAIGFPDGRVIDFGDDTPGVPEHMDPNDNNSLLLADGGKVVFTALQANYPDGSHYTTYQASQLIDAYGHTTTLSYEAPTSDQYGNAIYRLAQVRDDTSGKYLQISYNGTNQISMVQAFDALGRQEQWVQYNYTSVSYSGSRSYWALTQVTYSDGTSATYTYQADNSSHTNSAPGIPLLKTCDDSHYRGPMRQIRYSFVHGGKVRGKLLAELNFTTGDAVSTLTFPSRVSDYDRTEKRGDGKVRKFSYNSDGHLKAYTDFAGNVTTVADDANGYVGSVQDARPQHYTTSYSHDATTGRVLQLTHDPTDGTYVSYTYSANNPYLLTSRRNEKGDTTTYVRYQPNEAANGVVQPPNAIKEIDYPDGKGGVFATETFTYNQFGQLLTHKLANGYYEHFAYDQYAGANAAGRLIKKWLPTTDPNYPPSSAAYMTFSYYEPGDIPGDPWLNRVKTKTLPANVSNAVASDTYEYDLAGGAGGAPAAGRGLITKITHADGTWQSFEYDASGNVLAQEDELRQRTTYAYDDYSRVMTVTPPAGTGPTSYTYEVLRGTSAAAADTHTDKSVHLKTDSMGVVTEYQYDENFRLTSLIQQDGSTTPPTTTFDYDQVGNLIGVHDPRSSAWVTSYSYDARNRKVTQQDPVNPASTFHYGDGLNVTQIDRPNGNGGMTSETMSYDGMRRILTHTEPTGAGGQKTTTFSYTGSGMLASITDGINQTTYQYNGSDLKTLMTYPAGGGSQEWHYDAANNVDWHRTSANEYQRFTYDNRNRKVHYEWDNGAADKANFAYWDNNLLKTATNPNSTVTLTYDGTGRVLTDVQQINGLAAPQTVQHSYDDPNRQSTLAVAGTEYQLVYGYDSLGRFETIAGSNAQGTGNDLWFQYSYDAASNVAQRLCAMNGVAQIYTRDALGRISDLDIVNAESPQYATQAAAELAPPLVRELALTAIQQLNNTTIVEPRPPQISTPAPLPVSPTTPTPPALTTPQPPPLDASTTSSSSPLPAVAVPNPSSTTVNGSIPNTIVHSHYEYTNLNRVQSSGVSDVWAGWGYQDGYGYDDSGQQLNSTTLQGIGHNVSYQYDNAGNRTTSTDNGATRTYSPNSLNEYGVATYGDGDHRITAYAGVTYNYAADGRLRSASGNGASYTVKYDALGRAVRKTYTGSPHSYDIFCVNDGQRIVYEFNSLGVRAGWQLYGRDTDEMLLRGDWVVQATGQGYFYQQDRNGNVTYLTSFQGTVLEAYRYDGFGTPTRAWGDGGDYNNRFYFTGREYLPGLGVYDYRARLYHPGLGRFMSEDPLGHTTGDANLFRYVGNDPLNASDPLGLQGQRDNHPHPQEGGGSDVWGEVERVVVDGTLQRAFDRLVDRTALIAFDALSRAYDGYLDRAAAAQDVDTMFKGWLTGTGPESVEFGTGSPEANLMMDAPGVQDALADFGAINSGVTDPAKQQPVPARVAQFGAAQFVRATVTWNPIQHFVGSYQVSVAPAAVGQVRVTITNSTNFWSFAYHLFPQGTQWNRSTFSPMGNTTQTISWVQKYP